MLSPARLRIVTGKGGVGKTVVATSLALRAARAGQRVLLAELHAGDRAAALLEVPAAGPEIREVLPNLHLVDMHPREAIREFVMLTVHFEAVYKAVFENRLVRHFLRLVPSLGELTLLGKLWYHEQERERDRPRFDLIVLDAPATGHAISLLRAPAAVAATVPAGPMRQHCEAIQRLLEDPRRTALHLVTTPEEMPVHEAIALEHAAVDTLHLRVGTTVINQRTAILEPSILDKLAAHATDPMVASAHDALRVRQDKANAGEAHLARLPSRMLAAAVSLPHVVEDSFGRATIERLAGYLPPVGGAP